MGNKYYVEMGICPAWRGLASTRAHISCSTVRKHRCLYSLRCREGSFSATGLPANLVLENSESEGIEKPELLTAPASYPQPS
jgi:hypothetical protein